MKSTADHLAGSSHSIEGQPGLYEPLPLKRTEEEKKEREEEEEGEEKEEREEEGEMGERERDVAPARMTPMTAFQLD